MADSVRPARHRDVSHRTGSLLIVSSTDNWRASDDVPDALDEREAQQTASLLKSLNEAQRSAVTSDATTLRILAGAGSGKTRVLTHRIAHRAITGDADPARVLAVTFTRKAASELRDRLARLGLREGVQAGTFHAVAWAQLRQRWEERGVRPPDLLDRKVGFVARLCPGRDRTLPLDMVSEIEWASARLVDPEAYPTAAARAHRRPPIDLDAVAGIYQSYVDAKKKKRMVDFDDLLRLAARDLEADPVHAAARRWRFRHIYVDEFQDVNPLQHRLLDSWLGPESSLCVVGDPNQAIYAWNGADASYLVDFERFHPGSETVALADNYRSTPEILAAANGVLAAGPSRLMRLRPNRAEGPRPTIRSWDDETTEARGIVRACRDKHRPGDPWRHQAVLVRTNAQAAVLAETFGAAGIPHRVRGAGALLDQPEVKEAMNTLRSAPSVDDFVADLERTVATGADDDGTNLTEERLANLAELVRLGREFLALEPTGTPAGFTAWLRSTLRDTDISSDAVEIVTFHAAKGLEWPIVHIAGLEKGYVPIHHAEDDPESVEEERRLLYVALTRARDELLCNHAARRAFGSRSLRRSPSPWLDDMRRGLGEAPRREPGRPSRRNKATKAALRERAVPRDEDRPLFESLRAWRKSQASAAGVPAFVVFNDETLRAVAAKRPSSNAELLDLPGIGAVKVERFGPDLLRLVAESQTAGAG